MPWGAVRDVRFGVSRWHLLRLSHEAPRLKGLGVSMLEGRWILRAWKIPSGKKLTYRTKPEKKPENHHHTQIRAFRCVQGICDLLPSLKLTWPLKMVVSNGNFLFQGSIFRGYVSFREGSSQEGDPTKKKSTHPAPNFENAKPWRWHWVLKQSWSPQKEHGTKRSTQTWQITSQHVVGIADSWWVLLEFS